MPTDAPIVELRAVTYRFRRRVALDHFSLPIPAGAVIGLLGPNGAGKTTVINLVAGLAAPSDGEVLWRGEALSYPFPPTARRQIGLLPQETALYEELTARENLRFAADLFAVNHPARRVDELLDLVGLGDRASDRVGTYSGGMQRRLAFARALVHDPELLVLDEPTLGVDVDARHALWGHIRRLRRLGRTVLLTTNYLDEAEALCDEVVALRDGRAVAHGSPADLLRVAGRCVEIDCQDSDVSTVQRARRTARRCRAPRGPRDGPDGAPGSGHEARRGRHRGARHRSGARDPRPAARHGRSPRRARRCPRWLRDSAPFRATALAGAALPRAGSGTPRLRSRWRR